MITEEKILLQKCTGPCKASYSPDQFRKGHRQCRQCERDRQNKSRREMVIKTGIRFDPTRTTTDIQKRAMRALHEKCDWSYTQIAEAFHTNPSSVGLHIRKLNGDL